MIIIFRDMFTYIYSLNETKWNETKKNQRNKQNWNEKKTKANGSSISRSLSYCVVSCVSVFAIIFILLWIVSSVFISCVIIFAFLFWFFFFCFISGSVPVTSCVNNKQRTHTNNFSHLIIDRDSRPMVGSITTKIVCISKSIQAHQLINSPHVTCLNIHIIWDCHFEIRSFTFL